MSVEPLLPPYTPAERSRELHMQSRALHWRVQRAKNQNRQLRVQLVTLMLRYFSASLARCK